jgi:AcrR family transcriptional regulator
MAKRREEKKQATREALIEAAVRVIGEKGFEGATVEEIATRAGTGKGTFYNYFEAKEDVVVAFMAGLEERTLPAVKRYAEMEAPLEEILDRFAWHWIQVKKDYKDFLRVFLARMIAPGSTIFRYVVEMQVAIDATLDGLFDRLEARGLVREGLDREMLRLNFKTAHLGLTVLWAIGEPSGKTARRVVKEQMRMFAKGIAA